VNTLTAQSGTLFVVSAGNEGPSAMTIGSPGSADAALTVAAVDRRDAIADFSSRGPRVGDYALKPDIAAPGVGIVAARAHGTLAAEAVDANYAALSGTSMSAPHVTGAAALLAQQHPDWKADRLKEALVSSAAPATGGILGVDTGRVDVARAVEQSVTASDSLSFGIHRWPHTRANDPPVTRTVTYRNDAATDLTLNLALAVTTPNGSPRPRGMFAVPSSVTVPAHGSASVPVTVDTAAAGPDGQYTAMLTGTSADGAIRVRTALAVDREVESHDLTVSVTDRTGKPTDTLVNLVRAGTGGADEPADHQTLEVKDGTGTIRLPKGVWNLSTAVVEKTRH
jgi:hypothetical protein